MHAALFSVMIESVPHAHVQERMANMLNDCEISPTNYMIAFLRQRGWHLPEVTMRIPNVIPEVDPIAARVTFSFRIMPTAPFMAASRVAPPDFEPPSALLPHVRARDWILWAGVCPAKPERAPLAASWYDGC